MSIQRRRGQAAVVYPSKAEANQRGEILRVPDMDNPLTVRVATIPSRSARAEVPGQQDINVTKLILTHQIENLDIWSRVRWRDAWWDVVTPPAYHHGTRHTRHYSIDVRERP